MLSQQHYIQELPVMNIDHCIKESEIADVNDLRSTFRHCLGSLILVHQTRPDVGFAITQIATVTKEALVSVELAKEACMKYNRIAKFMRNRTREIHYTQSNYRIHGHDAIAELMQWRIISFADAGFGSLTQNHSVEGNFLVLGHVVSRGGVVYCHGGLLGHRCSKIRRVCKSSLSADTHSAITASGWSLWFQVFLIELFASGFGIRRISPPTKFPLRNPFGKSPPDQEVREEVRQRSEASEKNPAIVKMAPVHQGGHIVVDVIRRKPGICQIRNSIMQRRIQWAIKLLNHQNCFDPL